VTLNQTHVTKQTCATSPEPTPSATLTLIKTVINDDGGTKVVSDFPLFVGTTSVASDVATTLTPDTYTASETSDPGYTASVWGGDCAADGSITLVNGDAKTCTITNDDNTSTPTPEPEPEPESTPTPTPTPIPTLPNTGIGPDGNNIPWNIIALVGIIATLSLLYVARRKQTN
ncbi:MAG: hypothetical protein WD883_00090, partial [Candidatus Colwellbacteria bacterium]